MADFKLIGKDFSTPDLVAKVTGRAKYAEDFRAEGMLFTKLFTSPMPHARVRSIDASEALAMPGVEAILTADDLPTVDAPNEVGLTNEPMYEGEPILAVAAVDEETAAEAIERIHVDLEPLPFCLDPLDSLRPDGPNARLDGNSVVDGEMATLKWTDADFSAAEQGALPMGEATDEWAFGDVEAGLASADVILDETVFHQSLSHQPLETRTTMAHWQNGKVYVYPSVQSTARTVGPRCSVGRRQPERCGAGERVHGRWIWQQDQRVSATGVPDSSVKEDWETGHDACHPSRRELLWPSPTRSPRPRQDRAAS